MAMAALATEITCLFFRLLDSDKKGFVPKEDFATNLSAAFFAMLDKDSDSRITRKEFEAGFILLDLDGDGRVSKDDFNEVVYPEFSKDELLTSV